mgnify:CR=1
MSDPLGLAGFSKEIEQGNSPKRVKTIKNKRRTKKETQKILRDIFKPALDEKMRRKWDSIE